MAPHGAPALWHRVANPLILLMSAPLCAIKVCAATAPLGGKNARNTLLGPAAPKAEEAATMPTEKLTAKFISKLRAPHPSGMQVIYFDETTKGFGVQVSGTTTAIDYIAQRDLPNMVKGARKQT